MGLMAYNDLNDEQTLSWFSGTFREGSGDKTFLEYSNEGDWGTTTRLVWLPYYDAASGGRYLAHLGGAYEFTGANNNNADSQSRSRSSPKSTPRRRSRRSRSRATIFSSTTSRRQS